MEMYPRLFEGYAKQKKKKCAFWHRNKVCMAVFSIQNTCVNRNQKIMCKIHLKNTDT